MDENINSPLKLIRREKQASSKSTDFEDACSGLVNGILGINKGCSVLSNAILIAGILIHRLQRQFHCFEPSC